MFEYYKLALSKYATFTGRSRRSEYWYFQLVTGIIGIVIYFVTLILAISMESMSLGILGFVLYMLFAFGTMIPGLAVMVRRLHDIGRSGWSVLFGIIPLVGPILVLVWTCTDSDPGTNQYGPNPKVAQSATLSYADHLVD